jgi:predicted MFS family arabinose efflux permease
VLVPPVAQHGGLRGAFLMLAGICLLTAALVTVFAQDPPRPERQLERTGNPYRQPVLWRVHGASALLVVPQFVVAAFAVEYLVTERHFDPVTAGRLVVLGSLAGAAARLLAGKWSDVVGSRLRPMRWLAYLNLGVVGLLALAVAFYPPAATVLLLVAGVITVSTNGLAFTAVAELAGPAWAGRALGAQNTMQNLSAAGTPAIWGALIGGYGFSWGYAAAALFPLLAALTTPAEPARPALPARRAESGRRAERESGAEQGLAADAQHVARHAARTGSGEEGDRLRDIYG